MKKFSAIVLLLFWISSCKTNAESHFVSNSENQASQAIKADTLYNVRIELTNYYPYCGAASPSEDQLNNYSLCANTTFLLTNKQTGTQNKVTTNDEGFLLLNLPKGEYGLKETYKDCSFDEFVTKMRTFEGNYYFDAGLDCYKTWWASNFLEFSIDESTLSIDKQFVFSEACFTGINPCVIYNGPMPP